MSSVRVACGHCGATLRAPAETVGLVLSCPQCRQDVHIPDSSLPQQKARPSLEVVVSAKPLPPPVPPVDETAEELQAMRRELARLRQPAPVQVHVHERAAPPSDGAGVASFVIGVIAFFLMTPCTAIVGIPLAALGCILAVLGLCSGGRGFAIAGGILNTFVLAVAVIWVSAVGLFFAALTAPRHRDIPDLPPPPIKWQAPQPPANDPTPEPEPPAAKTVEPVPEPVDPAKAAEQKRKEEAEQQALEKLRVEQARLAQVEAETQRLAKLEADAARKLGIAKSMVKSSKELMAVQNTREEGQRYMESAVKRLRDIVRDYPKTAAAAEAKKLIDGQK